MINEGDVLRLRIMKLRSNNEVDLVWDLHEWLEYNKDKTGQLIKIMHRQREPHSSKEQYIVILFEKILEEFSEPFFGYLRVNITINKAKLKNDQLNIDDRIKFYFWINVAGITTINEGLTDPHPIFKELKNYCYINKNNGFKVLNDKDQTQSLMLPDIKNQGEEDATRRRKAQEQREWDAKQAEYNAKMADNKGLRKAN